MDPLSAPSQDTPSNIAEFIKAQELKNTPPPKAPCNGCKKSLTLFDAVLFGLALYGSYKLGITGKELISGLFQKTETPE